MKTILAHGGLLVAAVLLVSPAHGREAANTAHPRAVEAQGTTYGEELGTVRLPGACSDAARRHASRGLALLHHMTYEGARAAFTAATEADPDCAMGYWGRAMSYIHPLWSDPPSESDFEKGRALVNEALAKKKTAREEAYISAVEAYYAPGWSRDEEANLAGFEEGWRRARERFPEDPEAATFYALAHMATADPADKSYAKQKQAAKIAREVLRRIPDHPGAHHYTVHAYDYPPLAEKALPVARSYGKIAPAVPHALHMPSHIFTRLGLWQKSIAMNSRSAEAALKHPAGDKVSLHYPHALDYLAYAYLQRADDRKAEEILETIKNLEGPFQPHPASAYAFAAIPARAALERQHWTEAARLEPRQPENFPWDRYPAMEAMTHFARALGSARSGDMQAAREALGELVSLREQAAASSAYWANQVEIQLMTARAWLEYAEGRQEQALERMRRAAEEEADTEKHPITPGEVLPARELLADMLLDMGRHQEAHEQYLQALERSPNRFNSLYGAGRAAELAGDDTRAAEYYRKLVDTAAADAQRKRLKHAESVTSAQ
jgi:tetratricopeptide (TPR) repeat protein